MRLWIAIMQHMAGLRVEAAQAPCPDMVDAAFGMALLTFKEGTSVGLDCMGPRLIKNLPAAGRQ